MSARNDIAPETVSVELLDHGIAVEYIDGRQTLYRGVPKIVTDSFTTPPGKQTHILVTDPTETEGVLLYINDLKTHDDVLESSGVGRVVLEQGSSETVFPGVTVSRLNGMRTTIEANPETARGRVFVFVEDDWSEQSYEFVQQTTDSAESHEE